MLRRRLDPELHGSDGYTTIPRVVGVATCIALLAVALHLALTAYYAGRILPGVVAAGQNVGGLTTAQARTALQRTADAYQLSLTIAGQTYHATAPQLGVTFDPEATLAQAYATGRRSLYLPLHTDPIPLVYHLNQTQLTAFTTSVTAHVGVPPVDAAVIFQAGQLQTVPDKSGITVSQADLQQLIERNLQAPTGNTLSLSPRPQAAAIQASMLGPTISEAQALMATPVVLTYNGRTFTPTATDIGQWLKFSKTSAADTPKLVPQIDIAKLKSYVQTIANQLNVAPVTQKVTVQDGVSHIDQPGANGTAIDQDAAVAAVAAAITARTPLTYTITGHTIPFTTTSTSLISLGYDKYIEINLSKQHLWVWQDHNVIYDSPLTSGATGAGFPTVTGLFSIYYKTTNTHLVGYQYGPRYNYDVFVQYWMPFYQGFGLHDASWRSSFGGPDYYYGGSHGCVNLPLATAAFLYSWSDIGTPVWVHN